MAEDIDWSQFKVRCSAIGDVMSNSRDNPVLTDNQVEKLAEYRKRADGVGKPLTELQKVEMVSLVEKEENGKKVILSDTCIDYLMIEYAWIVEKMIPTGKESLDLVAIKKGNLAEYDSMVLLTRLDKLPYKQHKERIYSKFLSGIIDIYLGDHVMAASHIADLKNSWDYPVFLQKIKKKLDPHQDLQVKGYMSITGAGTGEITHTLVNTPDVIIEDMKWKVAKKMNALTIESPEFIEEWIKWEHSMRFDKIPLHKRVWRHKVERWSKPEEEKVHDRVKICGQWLSDFHERYQKMNLQ